MLCNVDGQVTFSEELQRRFFEDIGGGLCNESIFEGVGGLLLDDFVVTFGENI